MRLAFAALAAAALAGAAAGATAPPRIVEAGGATFPERSYILSLPYAKSLTRSDVHVTENGGPVSALRVTRQGEAATRTAVVLAIDESLTMKGKPIENALAAARAFARGTGPNRQVAIVTFNGAVKTLQSMTSDQSKVDDALAKTPDIVYGTKNYDALQQALKLIQDSHVQSGSVIILTDGQNVGSVAKPADVLSALRNAHVRVFPVGLQSPAYRAAPMRQMASTTGGSYVEANSPAALRPLLVTLGRQLAREYLLDYKSRQNPSTNVNVAVAVAGVPGVATSEYTAPALHLLPPQPYNPSTADRVIQSPYTMIAVALLFAALIGYAVSRATSAKPQGVVDRVGDFVSVKRRRPEAATEEKTRRYTPRQLLTRVHVSASRARWSERLAGNLELADIDAEPVQVVILTTFGTLVAMLILGIVIGWFGVLAALAVPFIVRAWILGRISRKRRSFADQLPDNLDVLASALRAGHSLVSALTVVAGDAVEPSKSEFRRVIAEEQFGANLEDAFKVVVVRMRNQDLDQVALVARLQREVGSNSAEVLDRVIETVRARMELRRLIRSLTAQGRLSRWILTLLPIAIALVLTLMSHKYMAPLFDTSVGRLLLVMAVIMVTLGSWAIGKIVDIEV
jgi:tight adherence protein B